MYATSDLVPLLAERGVVLSREQVYRLVAKVPERISLLTLAALCDALEVSPAELVEPVRANAKPASAQGAAGSGSGAGRPPPPGQGGPKRVSPARQQTWRDLVTSRVAEACPGLSTGAVSSAIAAAAPSAKALSVLARSLEPGPGALAVGAPPVVGRLVSRAPGPGGDACPSLSVPAAGGPTRSWP